MALTVEERLAVVDQVRLPVSKSGLAVLEKAMKDRSPRVRYFAIHKIFQKPPRHALPLLIGSLSDSSSDVRWIAVEGLGNLRDPAHIPQLVKMLKDPDQYVRVEAAEQLGYLCDASAEAPLLKSLSDPSRLVRAYAAYAVGCLRGDTERRVAALERLLKKEKDARVRLDTTGALYLLGQEDRLNEVLEYLSHREQDLRCAAANLLADLPSRDDVESIERIEGALRNRIRSESSTLVLSILRSGMRTLRKLRASV